MTACLAVITGTEDRQHAYVALSRGTDGSADGPDVRGMPDGKLLHLRDTYPIETAWAPQYVGDELRQVRAAAWGAQFGRSARQCRSRGRE